MAGGFFVFGPGYAAQQVSKRESKMERGDGK
jgi:hypothetical protein